MLNTNYSLGILISTWHHFKRKQFFVNNILVMAIFLMVILYTVDEFVDKTYKSS